MNFLVTLLNLNPLTSELLRVEGGLGLHLQGMVGFTPPRGLSKPHVCPTL